MKKNDLFRHSNLRNILVIFTIIALSFVFVYPIFVIPGLWASFDTPFHVTMIAQFHYALQYWHLPVVWTQGVANYGLPFGLIAHPMTSYGGGLLTFLTHDPVLSYKILWLIFSCISTWGMYRLLRRFFGLYPAIVGSLLYVFSAYRILNIYIRGALPEFAAAAFLPFLLNALFDLKESNKKIKQGLWIAFWFSIILFTHPMYAIFAGLMTGIFILFYYRSAITWFVVAVAMGLAIGINSYYLIPLKLELKYFYLGQQENMLAEKSGLLAEQVIMERWDYTCPNGDTAELRCNRVQVGIPEIAIFAMGIILLLIKRNDPKLKDYSYFAVLGAISLILTLQYIEPLYRFIPFAGSIQFPYRFLNIFLLIPPVFIALLISSLKRYQHISVIVAVAIILLLRIPQLYTKSEYDPSRSIYYHSVNNIHSLMMNTIWMDESKNYPVKTDKFEIVRGKGEIVDSKVGPIHHTSEIIAKDEILLANYTFFFPGWHAYLEGEEVPIQWQDPAYRGFMTIEVPPGNHNVEFRFEDTSVRLFAKLLSIVSLFVYFLIFVMSTRFSETLDNWESAIQKRIKLLRRVPH